MNLSAFWEYFMNNRFAVLERTYEHIWLTLISLLIAVVIGVSLGIFITRQRKISKAVLGAVSVIQTIPSLALLGFLIPLAGIGPFPAIIALFLYALLPIVRGTFTGIEEVEPAIKEAARGMGMSDRQVLTKVELPLAIPVIFSGIRTATVINVGIATLCALIASGGLGEFIFRGIALNNTNMILAGAVPAALLAVLFDFVLGIIQKYIRQIIRPVLFGGLVIAIAVISFSIYESMGTRSFKAGFPAEFMERPDGYPGLVKHYGLELNTVELEAGLMYKALKENRVDVISGYSTDGRIRAYNFKVLEDDKNFFPPYYVAPTVRAEVLQKHPELREILNKLAGSIDNKTMRALNYRVDHDQEDPKSVAREFLDKRGFQTETVRTGEADITIGSKNFSEQYILAEIFTLLIENYSHLDVELKAGMGGTKICFDALHHDEIDLYPEYTGTAFLLILNADDPTREKLIRDKEAVYEYVKQESKKRYNIEWLQPLGFNNTYALVMREEQAEGLGIESITDLKQFLE